MAWTGEHTGQFKKKINKKRKRVNREGRLVASEQPLGRAIINYDIDIKTQGLFLQDGTHLSPIGNDIFLTTLQDAVTSFFNDSSKKLYNALV